MNIYILFSGVLVITIFLLVSGSYFHKKFFRSKEIDWFDFNQNSKRIHFGKKGKYSVALIGGFNINDFSISVVSAVTNENIQVNESLLKYRFIKNGVLGINYYEFYIGKAGEYLFNINDRDKISVKRSMLKSVSVFEKEVSKENLSILIKEYSSPLHFIFAIVLFIIGTMLMLLNVAYLLYRLGILKPT